jgi:hypothetical protein
VAAGGLPGHPHALHRGGADPLINKADLPAPFKRSRFNQAVVWFAEASGAICAGVWGYAYLAGI